MARLRRIRQVIAAFYQINVKNTFTYRAPLVIWMLGWLISFMTMVFVWQSAQAKGSLAGFSGNQIITYYFVGLLVWAVCGWHPFWWIAESIRNGDIVVNIFRPVDFHLSQIGNELGWHTVNTGIFLFFLGAIYFLVKDQIILDLSLVKVITFIFSLGITALVTFEFNMAMATAAFWLINAAGLGSFYWMAMSLFGGQIVPLAFFPKWLLGLVRLLPFRFMYSFPLEIYLGKLTGYQLAQSFLIGIFWIFFLHAIFRYFWNKGLKRYNPVGQ